MRQEGITQEKGWSNLSMAKRFKICFSMDNHRRFQRPDFETSFIYFTHTGWMCQKEGGYWITGYSEQYKHMYTYIHIYIYISIYIWLCLTSLAIFMEFTVPDQILNLQPQYQLSYLGWNGVVPLAVLMTITENKNSETLKNAQAVK